MSHPTTNFFELAAATAVFGVVVVIIQNFVGWLRTAWISVQKGEKVPTSIEDIFGMTGLVVVCLIVGLIVVPLVFGIAEYAVYIGGFLALVFGVVVGILVLLRDAVAAVLMQASRGAATEDITQLAGMLAASEAAKNRKPSSPRYKICTVIYSDGHTAEKPLVPEEIATWPVESNNLFEKEARSYRIIRIVDDSDATVWSDGKQELTIYFDGGEVTKITLPPGEIERWAYKTQISGRLIEAICDGEGYVIWPEKDGSRIL